MNPIPPQPAKTQDIRFRMLAVGYLALLCATWRLWTPQTVFPQVPLFRVAGQIPPVAEWSLLVLLLISLSLMFIGRNSAQRLASVSIVVTTTLLIAIDQHRLQPWAWQFLLMSAVLATADEAVACCCWRWLVIGIYFWSAWSKMDHDFCLYHGPFLLDGICKAVGFTNGTRLWPGALRFGLAAAIPVFELFVAVGLCWQRTRMLAVFGSAVMHVGLLVALGPLGHGHQWGVLAWNIFFLIQNWWLFRQVANPHDTASVARARMITRSGNMAAVCLVSLAMAWPLLEPLGLCDHWPAWVVYAARPERLTVSIATSETAKLPADLQSYLAAVPTFDDWNTFRIDRWSLDAVSVPLYPQDRFQVGVALGLAEACQLDQMQIVIEGPADRWTGKRTFRQFVGLASIRQLADSYRCNGRPRSHVP